MSIAACSAIGKSVALWGAKGGGGGGGFRSQTFFGKENFMPIIDNYDAKRSDKSQQFVDFIQENNIYRVVG